VTRIDLKTPTFVEALESLGYELVARAEPEPQEIVAMPRGHNGGHPCYGEQATPAEARPTYTGDTVREVFDKVVQATSDEALDTLIAQTGERVRKLSERIDSTEYVSSLLREERGRRAGA
jgi:hypothetical protein